MSSTAIDGTASRAQRLQGELTELELDALLVETLIDVRYLTGFTGSHGLALVVGEQAQPELGPHRFLTDFRYTTQSAEQVSQEFEREIVTEDLLKAIAGTLTPHSGRLGFDEASLTVKEHRRLGELLGERWELVPCTGLVQRLRAIKDAGEIACIAAACRLADEALRGVLEAGLVGRTEREVALDLELRMRNLGAQAPSFSSIVAAGSHGALPHAEPRDEQIPRDVLVTIDWGALHEGYCSDCTRTYATGERLPAQAREIYELVLNAEQQGLAAVKAGPNGRDVDAVAREVIEQAGHGEHFGHGLGHGVGLEIHEAPRLSRMAGDEPLRTGNIVTVEPGVYLPGVLGVRIEDLVVVREGTHEVLTSLPKDLTVVT
ncbi:MAG TPA: Xaa-Pro peptidase family protein [Solirubrobacteraceae bacterium]|jgi:Xaa-Pro aminopeptidase|nr:Xaa-Pro peptidase family protein [Solirubrobacteraceae bacterium]